MLTPKIKHSLAIIISSCILAACSSSSNNTPANVNSSSSSSTASSSSAPATVDVTISGEAAKGIIIGGTVTAHPIANGAIDYDTVIGTDTTDSAGSYSIDISAHTGGPVAVRVTPATDGSTTMTCDLAAGCGDVAFGSPIALTDSSFSLDAVVPSATEATLSVNISVLTDTAASVTVAALADNTDTSATAIAALIDDANNSVANRFGITGNLTEIAIVDITDPVAVAAADSDVLEYNLYSAAVIEVALAATDIDSIEAAVASFAAEYATAGGIADTVDITANESNITLANIFTQASLVIKAIEDNDSEGLVDLGELTTEVNATTADIKATGSTDVSDGSLDSATGNTTELVKVKTMVNDLRNLGTGIDLTNAETFADQIDLASDTFDSDAAAVFEAMGMAASAIAYAWEAHLDDSTITTYTDTDNQLSVTIGTEGTTVTYNVTSTMTITDNIEGVDGEASTSSTSVAVDLTAVDSNSSFTDTETDTENSNGSTTTEWTGNAKADFNLIGTSTSDKVALTITKGIFKATVSGSGTEIRDDTKMDSAGGDHDTVAVNISDVLFDLEITLAEAASSVTNPITFTGGVKLEISDLKISSDEADKETYSTDGAWTGWMSEKEIGITSGTVDVTISGAFSSSTGDKINASLAIHFDGKNKDYVCSYSEEFIELEGHISEDSCTEETSDKLIGASITLIFGLDVAGVSNDISVELTGSRTALKDGTLSLEIQYDGKTFDAEINSADQTDTTSTLTITNQDNIIITFIETTETTENGDEVATTTGTISLNGTDYATITDKNDFVQISYADGSNVSL